MTSKSRGIGVLSRNLRSRSSTPAIYAICSSKRCMATAADSNLLSQHGDLPASIVVPSQHVSTMIKPGTTNELESDPNDIRPPRAVQLAYLRPLKRTAKYRIPTCNLQLRSYSVRNLEFFASFALRAAYFLNLPAVGPIPLPREIERWTVPKGHFIHKKSQENFERITMKRLIQIQDGHPETVQMWLAYLRKRQYYGVGMKANVWTFEKLGLGKEMDIAAEKGESLEQRWTSQFTPQMTPEVQAEVDGWMEKYGTGSSENISLGMPETKSLETNRPSVQKRIEEILAQIEQQAANTTENPPELSDPMQVEDETSVGEQDPSTIHGIVGAATPSNRVDGAEDSSSLGATVLQETVTDTKPEPISPAETTSPAQSIESASLHDTNITKKSTAKKATRSTAKRNTKATSKIASKSEEAKAPQPSDIDTSKGISTPEEADPAVEPQTEKAKEAEKEDAQEPLGDLPKTPS